MGAVSAPFWSGFWKLVDQLTLKHFGDGAAYAMQYTPIPVRSSSLHESQQIAASPATIAKLHLKFFW